MATREQIVERARAYVGTPFRHQGRRLGQAIDCVGLALCVADDLGLEDVHGAPFHAEDYLNYTAQPVDSFVHDECCRRLEVVEVTGEDPPIGGLWILPEKFQPGRVLTLRLPDVPCHVGIVSGLQGGLGIIHAYAGIGKVVEHVLDVKWLRRVHGVFEFP